MKGRHLIVIGCSVAISACASGPRYHAPEPDEPAAFAAQVNPPNAATANASTAHAATADAATANGSRAHAVAGAPVDLTLWWRSLNDGELNTLVDRAVESNLDIEIALDRLQQARAYEAVVVGHALPEVDASGAAGRGTGSDLTKGRADQALRSADDGAGLQHINTIVGFDAVWEIDLFGKYRREFQAVRAEADAARAARYDVLTSVIGNVVRAYVDLRGLQVRAGILRRASDVLRESLRIVNIRYERGFTNELDVALANRELATLEGRIAPVEAEVKAAQYALAVLVGEYPENMVAELSKPGLIPTMPAAAGPGVPVDLLKRRPDIQQAERELAAATARIGVATAGLFPDASVSASIGSQSQGWGTAPTVGRHIWSFGPGAIWPLLDFGALDAQVEMADYAAKASLAHYRQTILNAVEQVDSSIDAYEAQEYRMQKLGDALAAAQRAVDLATARYDRGLTDFLNVVDAEREFYDLQEQYAEAQVSQGEQFVQLYKSLGGGWQDYRTVPKIRAPQPAIVAAFRSILQGNGP
jgi:NodT family efflux transporter outer membrane factor (OMF) lipoprotein